jgi:hypothetical protein
MNGKNVKHVLSVDLAQSNDYTAAVAIRSAVMLDRRRHYEVGWLHRMRGTSYPEQIELIAGWYGALQDDARQDEGASVDLVIDSTGVGKPIFDELKRQKDPARKRLKMKGVMITGGNQVTRSDEMYMVPKITLVTSLQIALESGRLKIKKDLPLAATLVRELRGFKVHFTESGRAKFGNDVGLGEWRVADHDDMVLAVALGVWSLEAFKTADREALRRASGLA